MGTFNELIHVIKDYCDEKDKEIRFLKNRIFVLETERKLLKETFLEGDYKALINYYSVEK